MEHGSNLIERIKSDLNRETCILCVIHEIRSIRLFHVLLEFVGYDTIIKCSTIGPSARAGKKVSAPTIRITNVSRSAKGALSVGRVPRLGGDVLLLGQGSGHSQHRDGRDIAPQGHS